MSYKDEALLNVVSFYESVYDSGQIVETDDMQDFLEVVESLKKSGYVINPKAEQMKREFEEQLNATYQ